MTENLLQFIWQFGYYNKASLTTTDGEMLTIIHPGTINKNQGPDFFGAKIKIGNTILAGTIELHTKTSAWLQHGHQNDKGYNNVILHVVFAHDEVVNNIPVLELSSRISSLLLNRYRQFMENRAFIPCDNNIINVNGLTWSAWKERLLAERLQRKAEYVLQLYTESNNHWEEIFWWMLARNLGGKINSDAFEAIARSLRINILAKHKSVLTQLEALLFGQAGLLNDDFTDDYPILLQREYRFLKDKYNLVPSSIPVLFLRMRPGNFPTIRLAQLAALIQGSIHLFSKIIEAKTIQELRALFTATANDFWHYHYHFAQPSTYKKKTVGADTIDNIIINTVAPVLFAYGVHLNDESYKTKALQWLEELAPETNHITKGFADLGISSKSAYDSQALIELKNEYCDLKRCLDCAVGNYLLREAAAEYRTADQLWA